jgi:glycosyltransferase involved in cell wall biosynthesis
MRIKYLHKKMTGVICISNYLYKYYKNKNIRCVLIPPLVNINDEKWNNNYVITNNEINLIFSGDALTRKNSDQKKDRLDSLLLVLKKIKSEKLNFKMNIVGISKEDYLYALPEQEEIVSYLNNNIEFFGRVKHNKSIELIMKNDLFIFLRDQNKITISGFPTKFVESITCKIPVITNKNSNLIDYMEEGINGFWIENDSIESLYNSLKKILLLDFEFIRSLKNNINNNIFHYENYIESVKCFLDLN